MKDKKNKKPINSTLVGALIDLGIGLILLLLSKLFE